MPQHSTPGANLSDMPTPPYTVTASRPAGEGVRVALSTPCPTRAAVLAAFARAAEKGLAVTVTDKEGHRITRFKEI